MGKYYKTAKPTFVDDAMYKAPYELMAKALAAKDADFKENEEALAELGDVGDLLKYMNPDEAKRNEIIKTFGDTSTSLSEAINNSPALADAYGAEIRKAQRAWKDEITSGTLRKMHRNEEQKTKLFGEIDKRQGVSEESKRLAQAVAMKDYEDQGGAEGGNFTEDMNIYKELDETKYVQHLKSVVNENGNNYSNEAQGEDDFIVKTGGSSRYIRRGRIEEIIDSDPATKDWKNEKMQQLEYKARLGEIDKEDIEEIYQKDYADFKENTVKKLEYEITGSVRGLRADSTKTGAGSGRNKQGYGGEAAIDLGVKKVDFNSTLTSEKNKKGEFKSPAIKGMFADKNKKLPGEEGYDEASGQAAFQKAATSWSNNIKEAGLSYKKVADVFRNAEEASDNGEEFQKNLLSLITTISDETGTTYSQQEMAGFLNAGQTHNFHLDPLVNAGDAMPLKQQVQESRSIVSAVANLPVGTDVTYFAYDKKNNMTGSGSSTLDELEEGQYISPPVDEAYTKTPYSEQGYLAQKNGDFLTTENADNPNEPIKYGTSPQEIQNYREAKALEMGLSPSAITVEMDDTKTSKESVARNYFSHLMQGKLATNVYKGHRYDYGNGFTKPKKNHFYYIKKEYIKKDNSRGTILIGVPQNSLDLTTRKYIK